MTEQADRWTDVGAAIRARMTELRMRQAQLVRASGVSDPTVRDLMRGVSGSRRDDTLWRVSLALGWPQDAIHRILSGAVSSGAPGAAPSASDTATAEALLRELEDLRLRVERLEREGRGPSDTAHGPGPAAGLAR